MKIILQCYHGIKLIQMNHKGNIFFFFFFYLFVYNSISSSLYSFSSPVPLSPLTPSSISSSQRYMTPDTSRPRSKKRRSYLTSSDELLVSPINYNSLSPSPKVNERTSLLSGKKVVRKITPIESIVGKKYIERNISNSLEESLNNSDSNSNIEYKTNSRDNNNSDNDNNIKNNDDSYKYKSEEINSLKIESSI